MKHIVATLLTFVLAVPAFAQEGGAPPAGMPDMTKMGPWSRKPTKDATKDINAYLAAQEESMMKGDVNVCADMIDFPVIMVTDDSSGKEMHTEMTREAWIAMMAPMMNMPEEVKKSMSVKAKHKAHQLSDTLAFVTSDFTVKMGKDKHQNKAVTMLVKVGDQWKTKMMAEAGWGDMAKQMAAPPAAPAKAAPAAPPAAPPAKK